MYRARDTRLDRTVAIKILPPNVSSDPTRRQRFEREAKAISSLNHPHICVLHDVGHDSGTDYLVMECLEGETLAKRLLKGPLPLDLALKYAEQIADALDKAHRHGIIHRDLKPANIMLTPAGAKLLDFGLAKPSSSPAEFTTDTAAPDGPLTEQGKIVGTIQYMSPEQIEGKELDGRSDIFSFGAVLYEMLTGKRVFDANNQLALVPAILEKDPPPLRSVNPELSPVLERAVNRCLAKDPEQRWQASRDLALELDWISKNPFAAETPVSPARTNKVRERFAWAIAAVFALACVGLFFFHTRQTTQPSQIVRSSLLPPSGSSFLPYNFAISPDGQRLAFVALGQEGKTVLWVRGLSSASAQELGGTDGATFPFWSPDSLHIGFFAQGRLKTADLVNSAIQDLCDARPGFGGSWSPNGIILYATGISQPLHRVRSSGGTCDLATRTPAGSSESHHWPFFLPDGNHFLYYVNWSGSGDPDKNGIYANSLNSDSPKLVSPDITGNVAFSSGNLVYVRDRTIMAQPFDTSRLQTTGTATPLTQQELDKFFDFSQSGFSVSQNGELIFQSAADGLTRLVWYDGHGKGLGQLGETGYEGPQFSPDGHFLAVYADDEKNGKHFIRILDLQSGVSRRLTNGGGESLPVWSPDGKYIAFRDSALNIEVVPVDASEPPKLLVKGLNVIPCDWSVDGQLIYMSIAGNEFPKLEVFSLANHKSAEFVKGGAEAQFSPDGKWIAYIEPPERQIVVQPFPGPGPHIQISKIPVTSQPRWSHDGRKIFFIQQDRKLVVAGFDPVRKLAAAPQPVLQTRISTTMFGWSQYAVAPDGRFLVSSLPVENSSPLTLLSGWPYLLPRN